MGRKRKNPFPPKDKDDNTFSSSKRPRPSYKYTALAQAHDNDEDSTPPTLGVEPRLDPTYGQRGAFPGLDDENSWAGGEEGGEELFYGPASDGLEYLRMVR